MSKADISEIYERLLARGYALTLFGDLAGLKQSGGEGTALCPFHADKNPSFSFSMEKPVFYCHGCGEKGDWLDYLQKREGLSFLEALNVLAGEAGLELRGPADREAWEREKSRADILGRALEFFQKALFSEKGKATLEYLRDRRGYSEDEIKRMELGYYPGQAETAKFLKTVDAKAAPDLFPFLNARADYGAVIPYRDPLGNLRSLWGRLTRPLKPGETAENKYKPFTEATGAKATPFNMDRAKPSKAFKETGELLIVEGYFDALAVREIAGLENVIALGGSSLQDKQLEAVLRYKPRAFILGLDGDGPGIKGAERALARIAEAGIYTYVLELPADMDPDDYIKAQGGPALVELYRNAKGGLTWRAERLANKYRNAETDPERDRAKHELLTLADSADPITLKEYSGTLEGLGISQETAGAWLNELQEKRARAELAKGYRELFKAGSELLEAGNVEAVKEALEKKGAELRAGAVTKAIEPYLLGELLADVRQARPGLKTGYKALDDIPIRIPQEAITIIAGRPSHGKTTLLMNLLLNMAGTYPDRAFFFFSYEESRKSIGLKLLNILSGEILDRQGGGADNLTQIEAYLKADNITRPRLEAGQNKYKELTESRRLFVIDEPYFVDGLADTLAWLRARYDIGAVFIDYIQKIKIKGNYQSRQIDLQKISERILEAAKGLSIPIILGSQLGRDKERTNKVRMDNQRESGDIEQDANLILGLLNEAVDNAQAREPISIDPENIKLTVTVLKNRNGPVNNEVTLMLNAPLWTIKDSKAEPYA
mgnify:CR=1 FL=1